MVRKRGRTSRMRQRKKGIKEEEISEDDMKQHNIKVYYELMTWISHSGYKPVKKLRPYIFLNTGCGLMTTENIQNGDLILSIPENLLITPRKVLITNPFIKKWCPDITGHEILIVFLVCEKIKGDMSKFHSYIRTIPEKHTTIPYFKSRILRVLPNSLQVLAKDQRRMLQCSFSRLNSLFTPLQKEGVIPYGAFTYDLYLWAFFAVNTRSVYKKCGTLQCRGEKCTYHLALAPFLDLLNHNCNAKMEAGYNKVTKCYEIRSLSTLKKYSQVFINYGAHSNRKLLLEYGFVQTDNINDVIPISIEDIRAAYKKSFNEEIPQDKWGIPAEKDLLSFMGITIDGFNWSLETTLAFILQQRGTNFVDAKKLKELNIALVQWKLLEYSARRLVINNDTYSNFSDEQMRLASQLIAIERDILTTNLHYLRK